MFNDRLTQAHAVVDLLYTLALGDTDRGEPIESLCHGTLIESLHGVMRRIEEAQEAAGKLPTAWRQRGAGRHSAGRRRPAEVSFALG